MTTQPTKELNEDLTALVSQSQNRVKEETDPLLKEHERAYAKGVSDTLAILARHMDLPDLWPDKTEPPAPIHQMTAAEAMQLIRENPEYLDTCPLKNLQEAAFKFENEFMACLGDMNTIFFDTYEAMSKEGLINIIHRSLDDINRVSGQ